MGRGDVAQLGERRTCTAEAVGSNPIISMEKPEAEEARMSSKAFWLLAPGLWLLSEAEVALRPII